LYSTETHRVPGFGSDTGPVPTLGKKIAHSAIPLARG
jgi:hypothetical protein